MVLFNKKTMDDVVDNLSNPDLVKGSSLWQDAFLRFRKNKAAVSATVILALMIILSFVGQWFAPWDYETIDWDLMGAGKDGGQPSLSNGHYFGVDNLGRDLFTRTLQGTQVSLLVGLLGTAVATFAGLFYGAIAGFVGGRVDNIMMRFVDILMSIPYMFIIIIVMVVFGRSVNLLFMAIGLFAWMDMARIVRGQTLAIKNKEYIEAARAAGVSGMRLITRHVIPNLLGVVVIYTSLLIPSLILTESFISFLGLGVQEPLTSWGALINEGAGQMQYGTPWMLAFPLSFFVVGLFCFLFIGDGLRDALDPKD
ncbi:MAG: ABC transporter permease subunit [OCS116 cluster bacterium]|uniref:Oligopeptide transport system permease protein OppC n=1 Tax=OCS116 cluster bacterium TaxID=2030921 RepID=A0A2A4Z8P0_9PROT|nr:ABC transporter permease subunit [OCS116 cluster bacterium]